MTTHSDDAREYPAAGETSSAGRPPSALNNIFMGPNGIRAGWRLAIFLMIFAGFLIIPFAISHIPAVRNQLQSQPKDVFTPTTVIFGEGINVVGLVLCAFIMTKIEKRSFADYGLPLDQAFGWHFWAGIPLGFAMLSLLLSIIAAFHGFSLAGMALSGAGAVKYGFLYAIVFILVGVFEEFSFRGYMQSTLASGVGFWPAAIILSIVFGAIHLRNPGEAIFGGIMAGSFGLLAAFALHRTGNIWLPIGMHASWDWGETYFYGTPDSGLLAQGHFLNSSFHGPRWLTGGSVGPEGSWLVFGVLIVWALIIHLWFPAKKQA
jgi:uncharacterized protein